MIYGRIVRSPYPHARIVSVDLVRGGEGAGRQGRARLEGAGRAGDVSGRSGRGRRRRHRRARARRGASGPRAVRSSCRISPTSNRRWPPTRPPCSRAATRARARREETGDLDAGFAKAAHIVEATYSTHVITHVCLETHGCVCEWDGDKLTAWMSTQAVHAVARSSSRRALKIPQANVRVHHAVHGRRIRQQVRVRTHRDSSARSSRSRRRRRSS